MLKYSRLVLFPAVLIALAYELFFAQAGLAALRLTVVTTSDADSVCYFQKSDGAIIDLRSLCEVTPTLNIPIEQDLDSEFTNEDYEKFKADTDNLKKQREQFPDTASIVKSICAARGRCPSPEEIRGMNIGK